MKFPSASVVSIAYLVTVCLTLPVGGESQKEPGAVPTFQAAANWSPRQASPVSIFLEIPDLPGDSIDADHQGWIEVLAFSEGIIGPAPVEGASQPAFQPIHLLKRLDRSSPNLRLLAATGAHHEAVQLDFVVDDLLVYRISLEDVRVSNVTLDLQGTRNAEVISLEFGRITWFYYSFDGLGNAVGEQSICWDVEANADCTQL